MRTLLPSGSCRCWRDEFWCWRNEFGVESIFGVIGVKQIHICALYNNYRGSCAINKWQIRKRVMRARTSSNNPFRYKKTAPNKFAPNFSLEKSCVDRVRVLFGGENYNVWRERFIKFSLAQRSKHNILTHASKVRSLLMLVFRE